MIEIQNGSAQLDIENSAAEVDVVNKEEEVDMKTPIIYKPPVVDLEISDTSENAVENKAIKAYVDEQDGLTLTNAVDAAIASAVNAAIALSNAALNNAESYTDNAIPAAINNERFKVIKQYTNASALLYEIPVNVDKGYKQFRLRIDGNKTAGTTVQLQVYINNTDNDAFNILLFTSRGIATAAATQFDTVIDFKIEEEAFGSTVVPYCNVEINSQTSNTQTPSTSISRTFSPAEQYAYNIRKVTVVFSSTIGDTGRIVLKGKAGE